MNFKVLLFTVFIVVVAVLTIGPPLQPLTVRVTVHDTISRIVPLRIDTVRLMEHAGNPSCALPAVVISVSKAEHQTDELTQHGHYVVQANKKALHVIAMPPNAKPGDVVCVWEDD